MTFKDQLLGWADSNAEDWVEMRNQLEVLVADLLYLESRCGKGLWFHVESPADVIQEASYRGLVMRRESKSGGWDCQLMVRGREGAR